MGERKKAISREEPLEIPEPGKCNFTALRKAARRISQLYAVVLAPCGLKPTQWSTLIHVGRAGNPTQAQLADSLALDRSALAHNLQPLEREGLIESVPDKKDRRSRRIALTPKGRGKLRESLALWENAQSHIEDIFGAEKAKGLRASLDILSSKAFSHAFEVIRQRGARRVRRKRSTAAKRTANKAGDERLEARFAAQGVPAKIELQGDPRAPSEASFGTTRKRTR